MSYKLYTNIDLINSDIQYINSKVSELYKGVIYGEAQLHPVKQEGVIDLSVWNGVLINKIKDDYINDEWLNTNIIETLDESWTWYMPEKPIRIIINNKGQLEHILHETELGMFLLCLKCGFTKQTFIDETNTIIYVSKIEPEYEPILTDYPDIITIENKNDIRQLYQYYNFSQRFYTK